jgi:hypothetical protein
MSIELVEFWFNVGSSLAAPPMKRPWFQASCAKHTAIEAPSSS